MNMVMKKTFMMHPRLWSPFEKIKKNIFSGIFCLKTNQQLLNKKSIKYFYDLKECNHNFLFIYNKVLNRKILSKL